MDKQQKSDLDEILEIFRGPEGKATSNRKTQFDFVKDLIKIRTSTMGSFLRDYTPSMIEEELNKRIIGQEELTRSVADFLYYHALRFLHPELPNRPMIIYGPSGSGKTEVWRVAKKIFGNTFHISIVDGTQITCEGWTGNVKLADLIDDNVAAGGILVIDEFDKLAKPRHNSAGDNVAESMQSELLKFLEGEYELDKNAKASSLFTPSFSRKISTSRSGAVMVGAFEDLRAKKSKQSCGSIGFGSRAIESKEPDDGIIRLTDEDFIDFGIMPEIIGRVAIKCPAKQLTDDDYIEILKNQYSRVSTIARVLGYYCIDPKSAITEDEIRELIKTSKSNRTGVRWVSAQVESKMLDILRREDIRFLIMTTQEDNKSSNEFLW